MCLAYEEEANKVNSKRAYYQSKSHDDVKHHHRDMSSAEEENSSSLPYLSEELLRHIMTFLPGDWNRIRSICPLLRNQADGAVEDISFSPATPSIALVMNLVSRFENLRKLNFTGLMCVNDQVIEQIVLCRRRTLIHLSVSYCFHLTPAIMPTLSLIPYVNLRGCWRLLRPSPSLSPEVRLHMNGT